MGKPTGFLEYTRCETGHRPAHERIQDFNEFLLETPAELIHTQSARCMDCGVPFCHAGMQVHASSIGCPLHNLIPEINDLVYRGDYAAAYKRMAKTHPFPEFTGRVCPALCEGSCTLGEHDAPVTIKNIERFLSDFALENGLLTPHPTQAPTGKKVAVVGSGPAGLACADSLSRYGHAVTVYEKADRPGGFLMYGIPNMKLDKTLVVNRVALLQWQGVHFECGVDVGGNFAAGQLVREYDAVVVCTGARSERPLDVPHTGAAGVYGAVEYLTQNTKCLLDGTLLPHAMDAEGKDVIVVGGGDTGTDCVATALRQGAKSVAALEIMPPLPEGRAAGNPWPLWPRVRKTDYGHEEAIALLGRDIREYETTVKTFDVQGGAVAGVKTVQVRWEKGPGGRMAPQEVPGTDRHRPAQLVLLATGFTGPERTLPEALGLTLDKRGCIEAGTGDSTGLGGYRTSLPSVFAAGDARRGPSLVVWAILEGMQAAGECHRYLSRK